MLLPHEVLGALHGWGALRRTLVGEVAGAGLLDTELAQWWLGVAQAPWAQDHPVYEHGITSSCIPVGLHGDDAGVRKANKVTALGWSGALVKGTPSSCSQCDLSM
jgi:hypothetical protein